MWSRHESPDQRNWPCLPPVPPLLTWITNKAEWVKIQVSHWVCREFASLRNTCYQLTGPQMVEFISQYQFKSLRVTWNKFIHSSTRVCKEHNRCKTSLVFQHFYQGYCKSTHVHDGSWLIQKSHVGAEDLLFSHAFSNISVRIELIRLLNYLVFVKEDTCITCPLPGNNLKCLSHNQKSFGGGRWKPPLTHHIVLAVCW